jgi:hypothetical protein
VPPTKRNKKDDSYNKKSVHIEFIYDDFLFVVILEFLSLVLLLLLLLLVNVDRSSSSLLGA